MVKKNTEGKTLQCAVWCVVECAEKEDGSAGFMWTLFVVVWGNEEVL